MSVVTSAGILFMRSVANQTFRRKKVPPDMKIPTAVNMLSSVSLLFQTMKSLVVAVATVG